MSETQRQQILDLAAQGVSMAEIASHVGVSGHSLFCLMRVKGLTSRGAYREYQARQKIDPKTGERFASFVQYREYLARQRTNPETGQHFSSRTELENYLARRRTDPETGQHFRSYTEYQAYLARKRNNPETGQPFVSYHEYRMHTIKQRINPETGQPFASYAEYKRHLALQKINHETGHPFASRVELSEYRARQRIETLTGEPFADVMSVADLARQRQARSENLGRLLQEKLIEEGKTQRWLARELGISKSAVSFYVHGKRLPCEEIVSRLFSVLNIPYQTLDELLVEDRSSLDADFVLCSS